MDEKENIIERKSTFITGVWSERVLVITEDYEIKGYVFMPKTGRRNRILTDILNSNKRFVAIKNCKLKHRKASTRVIEAHDFIQLNLNSIVMIRPALQEE